MITDNELEQRLRASLTTHAADIKSGPKWQGPNGLPAALSAGARGVRSSPSRATVHRWRIPILAAVAVAAVVVATSVVVAGWWGSGGASVPADGGATGTSPVTVPISCQFTPVGNASGNAVDPHGSLPSSMTGTYGTSLAPDDECTSPGSVEMSFVDGAPSKAGLSWTLSLRGNKTSGSSRPVRATGTPPSYISFGGAIYDGHRYLFGAVDAAVAQVQIQALQYADTSSADPGFSGASAYWTIGSGKGTAFSLPGQDDVIWTDLGGGWHAFAIEIPPETGEVDMTTLDSDGDSDRTRRFQLTAGSPDASELLPQTLAVTTSVLPSATPTK